MKRTESAESACTAGQWPQVDDHLPHEQSQSQCGNRKKIAAQSPRATPTDVPFPPREPSIDCSRIPSSHAGDVAQHEAQEDVVGPGIAHRIAVSGGRERGIRRRKAAAPGKLKKADGPPEIVLEPTPDILAELGAAKRGQVLVGFAAETDDLARNAREKLARKGVPLIVANDGPATFGRDDNMLLLVDEQGERELPRAGKLPLARALVADPTLVPGDVVVETEAGQVDARIVSRLESFRAALLDGASP